MSDGKEPKRQPDAVGLLLAQYALLEALVRHDGIGYHQLRETLADALTSLTDSGDASQAVLHPLRRLLAILDELHEPARPGERPRQLDWQHVLARCSVD